MTNKLYYEDPYLTTFTASIIKKEPEYVIISETAFYPTGGGQPCDIGSLNDISVVNVEIIDGEIRHFLAEPLDSQSIEVKGSINWRRRFDHMQQHAGQHILSAAFAELFQMQTVSFHLGKETATIDLDTTEVTEEQLKKVEELANQIILENRAIETKWVTEDELTQYKLRKSTSIKEDIRLVIIPDFDYNACGGTHPSSTGQVGSIKILQTEKEKRHIRVEFVCGKRVLTQLDRKQNVLLSLISKLSSPEEKLVDTANNLLHTNKNLEKLLNEHKQELLKFEAKELLKQSINDIVGVTFENRTIQDLQRLARFLVEESPSSLCVLVSHNEEKLQIVTARGTNREESMKALLLQLLPLINGKGGGNDTLAQGGGEAALSSTELLNKALTYIK
ncbi:MULTISPECIES: alanyl-tRNA editing protein [unclassified Psychrobacillus]|uniref:alanyl-tRNA editing protein n=1 Tax=unclassified Psychrobacillus TaxID=2636677 RepID=UPI00146B36F4|nr:MULTISPECIES: alanyl-tRNA editing protein [unclassified Psychrobacillus]MCM3358599.1 DHHA1 domain-containing protein [Psychrobacillus sp. MER TA 171]NME05694.1 alanyl-tRNA editing protein [Psychrobacillus sp. BL-248-WT-3]